MGPVEFIKTCFAIACVMLFFAIHIKISLALVDWLVERIRKAILKHKIKRLLRKLTETKGEVLKSCKDLEGFNDSTERTKGKENVKYKY